MGKISVTIDKLGRPLFKGHEFVGNECDEKMKPYEDAFRGAPMVRTNSPEYYQISEETEQQEEITL